MIFGMIEIFVELVAFNKVRRIQIDEGILANYSLSVKVKRVEIRDFDLVCVSRQGLQIFDLLFLDEANIDLPISLLLISADWTRAFDDPRAVGAIKKVSRKA